MEEKEYCLVVAWSHYVTERSLEGFSGEEGGVSVEGSSEGPQRWRQAQMPVVINVAKPETIPSEPKGLSLDSFRSLSGGSVVGSTDGSS